MSQSDEEIKLKEMAAQFNNLTMRYPGKMVTPEGAEVVEKHPYKLILAAFPDYESFYNYFSELALEYRTMGSYEAFLGGLYSNIVALGGVVGALEQGMEPEKINLMLRSFQMFMKMSQRKYQLSNTRMTRIHTSH